MTGPFRALCEGFVDGFVEGFHRGIALVLIGLLYVAVAPITLFTILEWLFERLQLTAGWIADSLSDAIPDSIYNTIQDAFEALRKYGRLG